MTLLRPAEYASARRSTLNAHYTDADIATSVWGLVEAIGFDGGRVLEPGCGTGVFLAARPTRFAVDAVGVELEPVTARIAALLHPDADIRCEGFETTALREPVDLAIGNVPFAKVALHDPIHNRGRHSIHNHFLIKALALTRPGGLLAALTSRYTLDARNPAARRELATLGDFVGAIRLPTGAHSAAAGTDVVTDLVVLRRRADGDDPRHAGSWEMSQPVTLDGGVRPVNDWFNEHPDLVLGQLHAGSGVYAHEDLTVTLDAPLVPALLDASQRLAALARESDLAYRPSTRSSRSHGHSPADGAATSAARGKEGSIHRAGRGFVRIVAGAPAPFESTPRKDAAELAALCDLRDTTISLLDAQGSTHDDRVHAELQRDLNERYDRYIAKFGPLNRFRLARTGRTDPTTGADTYRRIYPRLGGFCDDPDYRTLLALEQFDPDAQAATKASIFHRRVLAPAVSRHGADTADDALAITLDETGRVDIDRVARPARRRAGRSARAARRPRLPRSRHRRVRHRGALPLRRRSLAA